MTDNVTALSARPRSDRDAGESASTLPLLLGGLIAGPLFMVAVVAQVVMRDGFDLGRHPVSLLSLGAFGWIQTGTFIVCGSLILAFALGARRVLRRERRGFWMPLLTAVFGGGLIVAGVFPADPSLGFPPGTPPGTPEDLSLHASLHGLGFLLAFGSVAVACLVSVRRSLARGERLWAACGIVTALVAVGLSMWPGQSGASIRYFVAAVIVWTWTTLTAARLVRESANERSPMRGERDEEDHRRHVRVA